MLHRHHRHIEADHAARLPREIAAGRNDVFAGDLTLVSRHHPLAIRLLGDRGDGGVAVNGGAALTGALGQGLRQIGGLNIAILRVLDRPQNAVHIGQRPDFLDLVGRQEVDIDADGLGDAGIIFILVHPVWAVGEANVADPREADAQLGFGLQAGVEFDRILVDLAHRIAEVEQRQQARRMPCAARCQFLALDQRDIRPAHFGKMVQRADANNAATNDDHSGGSFHIIPRHGRS